MALRLIKQAGDYILSLFPCGKKRRRESDQASTSSQNFPSFKAKRMKPEDPEDFAFKSPTRIPRNENEIISLETITLPTIRKMTFEDIISSSAKKWPSDQKTFNNFEQGLGSASSLKIRDSLGLSNISQLKEREERTPELIEVYKNGEKSRLMEEECARELVFPERNGLNSNGKGTIITNKYFTLFELNSPTRLKQKVQELRTAATLGQAKLSFLSSKSALRSKEIVNEETKTSDPVKSLYKRLSEYTFQPSEGKIIRTRYCKDIFAQFTTIFDPSTVKSNLPPLPVAITQEVEKALKDPDYKLKNTPLAQRDFAKLQDGVWLNDEVINEYIELVRRYNKAQAGRCPDTLIFNTFMFTLLSNDIANSQYSYAKYKRNWERRLKVDISKKEQILFPINKHNIHWLLCRADVRPENPRLEIYDSLPSGDNEFIEEAVHAISTLLNDAFEQYATEDKEDWEYVVKECPRQRNGYDCGVCMCTNIEFLARGKEPAYTSQDTSYFRKKIAVELFQGQLLSAAATDGETKR